jgi:putative restriction endonuclease
VVTGGYEDDDDRGTEFVYTGHGGNHGGRQVADQTLTAGNMALAVSADQGLPVRVLRGSGGDPEHAPASGYRYDGLYYVDSYWSEPGKAGFQVLRFRLVRSPAQSPISNPPPGEPPSGNSHGTFTTTQRRIRSTAVIQWVKALYRHGCQICSVQLRTASGLYAEGAHIRPVGRPHDGPDVTSNVLCLCPNDHVKFDRGAIYVDSAGVIREFGSGGVCGQLTVNDKHNLDFTQFSYHRSIHEKASRELSPP